MDLDGWNRWLTLAANVGVIAGFVLVAFQLREYTAATRAQNSFLTYFDFDVGRDLWRHMRTNVNLPDDVLAELGAALASGDG